jgi:tripartite-type tricarboxylate transporter receptor subunit TctC
MIKHLLSGMLFFLLNSAIAAETWAPNSPVKIIVPFGAGGTTDIIARVISEKLSEEIKQPVIIENRAGAGGTIGTAAIARATPDGLTLGLTTVTTNASNQVFFTELPYHPLTDFEYVITIAATPKVFVSKADLTPLSFSETIKTLQQSPNIFTYGCVPGGIDYLYGETFKKLTNTYITFVPYKGGAQAMSDLMGGHIQFMFDNLPLVLPNVQSGKIKLLAISWPQRLKEFPDVPTWTELGYPQLNLDTWYGLSLPKNTPKNIVDYYNAAMKKVLADPKVQEQLRSNIAYVVGDTSEQSRQRVESTIVKLEKIASDMKLVKNPQKK